MFFNLVWSSSFTGELFLVKLPSLSMATASVGYVSVGTFALYVSILPCITSLWSSGWASRTLAKRLAVFAQSFAYYGFLTGYAHWPVLLTRDWHTFLISHEAKGHPHHVHGILLLHQSSTSQLWQVSHFSSSKMFWNARGYLPCQL